MMAKTSQATQEYVGCLLSMTWATVWDHSAFEEIDTEDPDFIQASKIVAALFEREITKNDHRKLGMMKHISEIKG